jgi:dephospho-CoA kinase
VVDYRPAWPHEFDRIARTLGDLLGETAVAIDHVGSTSVPGLAAKDCIDVQVRVRTLDDEALAGLFEEGGFRCRPEPWNRAEVTGGREFRKLVFAPPTGARPVNIHIREAAGANARFALLFRAFLSAEDDSRRAWATFKRRLAVSVPDLLDYGQIKAPATEILMAAAERWATATGWTPD